WNITVCRWTSIRPGSSVHAPQSTTSAPAGIAIVAVVPILSMRLPRSTTTGSFLGGAPVQSIMAAAVTYLTGSVAEDVSTVVAMSFLVGSRHFAVPHRLYLCTSSNTLQWPQRQQSSDHDHDDDERGADNRDGMPPSECGNSRYRGAEPERTDRDKQPPGGYLDQERARRDVERRQRGPERNGAVHHAKQKEYEGEDRQRHFGLAVLGSA